MSCAVARLPPIISPDTAGSTPEWKYLPFGRYLYSISINMHGHLTQTEPACWRIATVRFIEYLDDLSRVSAPPVSRPCPTTGEAAARPDAGAAPYPAATDSATPALAAITQPQPQQHKT